MGVHYYQGTGVEKNIVEAYTWLRIAESFGHTDASRAANGLSKIMSEADIKKGRAASVQWKLDFYKKKKAEQDKEAIKKKKESGSGKGQ